MRCIYREEEHLKDKVQDSVRKGQLISTPTEKYMKQRVFNEFYIQHEFYLCKHIELSHVLVTTFQTETEFHVITFSLLFPRGRNVWPMISNVWCLMFLFDKEHIFISGIEGDSSTSCTFAYIFLFQKRNEGHTKSCLWKCKIWANFPSRIYSIDGLQAMMADYKTNFCFSNFLCICISYRVNEMINSTSTAHPQQSMSFLKAHVVCCE